MFNLCPDDVTCVVVSRAAGASEKNEPSLIQKLAQASLANRDVTQLDPTTGAVKQRKQNTVKDVKTAQNVAVAKQTREQPLSCS